MELRKLFYTIFKSLNPEKYQELTDDSFSFAFKYFFFIISLSLILMLILFIPSIYVFPQSIEKASDNFGRLDVNFTFDLKQSFTLLEDPLIRVSNSSETFTNERILITPDSLYYKQFFYFGKVISKPLNEGVSIQNPSKFKREITDVFIFMLPSIFFWMGIVFSLYFAAVVIGTFIVGFILLWIINKKRIPAPVVLKYSVYSSTILIVLQLIMLPFYRLFLVPLVLYWILFILLMILYKEGREGKSNINRSPSRSESKNIFKDDDSVDVDEHGNFRGKKKKKSYDEENEGYVELK